MSREVQNRMFDPFFTTKKDVILRTHTSPGQIRAMRQFAPEPIRVVLPGKTFRNEDVTARSEMMFLPQKPFVPRSTLKETVCYPHMTACATEAQIVAALRLVNLENLVERSGGLDTEQEWRDKLSLGEQQRLTMARLILARPKYAFLDEATSALDPENERLLYTLLKTVGSAVISVGHRPSLVEHHEQVLHMNGDTTWRLGRTEDLLKDLKPAPAEGW